MSVRPYRVSSVRRVSLACAAALLGVAPALALAAPSPADPAWQLRAAADVGEDESRGARLSLDYAPSDGPFSFGVAAQYSEAALAGPAPGGDAKPKTTGFGADAGWLLGPALLSLGFDASDDEDFRSSDRWTAGVRVGTGGFGVEARVSRRATDFDPVTVGGPFTLRNGQTITLTGNVACDVDDTGYGLTFDWTGDRWSAYVGGSKYDYESLTCAFSANVPAELQRLSARRFATLSSAAARRFEPRAGGVIARETQLLESEFTAGVGYRFDVVSVSVDWFHGKDEFARVDQDDWSATLGFPLGDAWSLDLTGGMADLGGESSGYGGLAISVRL